MWNWVSFHMRLHGWQRIVMASLCSMSFYQFFFQKSRNKKVHIRGPIVVVFIVPGLQQAFCYWIFLGDVYWKWYQQPYAGVGGLQQPYRLILHFAVAC
mmetsp:Transcript_14965/g.31720  ORF Transcript_14965/g.31720 Transcript_14965/m.31720 type:complete len:98 (+) Transcript_14965:1276-1569(+)